MGTFIIGALVLAVIIGAVYQLYKDGKKGACHCSGCGKCKESV
ncbi:MAG: FeoB-associated Cys-rich membrane protein [Sporomusaceae bacterium]|jgi:hypothetical protein|nr:FeoB-associated Cys-rich membrane protein [Sporomusaceae bacterium]